MGVKKKENSVALPKCSAVTLYVRKHCYHTIFVISFTEVTRELKFFTKTADTLKIKINAAVLHKFHQHQMIYKLEDLI